MKTVLFVSTLFFLLGVKISKLIDFGDKVNVIDKIVNSQIIKAKPLDAFQLFKDTEEAKSSDDEEKVVSKEEELIAAE